MKTTATIAALCILAGAVAQAAEPEASMRLLGHYQKKHFSRDMSVDCSDKDDACGLGTAHDELWIERAKPDLLRVRIELVGGNFHTCTAEGEGRWEGSELVVRLPPASTFDEGVCVVRIAKKRNGTVGIVSDPYQACARYCGARANLYADGLLPVSRPRSK